MTPNATTSLLGSLRTAFRRAWRRLASALITMWLRLKGVEVGTGCVFYGVPRTRIARGARIRLHDGVTIRSGGRSNPFSQGLPAVFAAALPGALIDVGEGARLSSCVVVADITVQIGRATFVGAGSIVTDTDAHAVCAECRDAGRPANAAAVVVGERCFLGARSIVLKGTRLGADCVVGAGSVVTGGDYAPALLLVGVPARESGSSRCAEHVVDGSPGGPDA